MRISLIGFILTLLCQVACKVCADGCDQVEESMWRNMKNAAPTRQRLAHR